MPARSSHAASASSRSPRATGSRTGPLRIRSSASQRSASSEASSSAVQVRAASLSARGPALHPVGDAHLTLQQDVEVDVRIPLADDPLAGLRPQLRAGLKVVQLFLGPPRKQRSLAQDGVRAHTVARYWWTKETAMEPSPT